MTSYFQCAHNKARLAASLSCQVLLGTFSMASVAQAQDIYTFKDNKILTTAMTAVAVQTTGGATLPEPCNLHIVNIEGASAVFQKTTLELMNKALAEGIVGSERLNTCTVEMHELTPEDTKLLIAREQVLSENAHIFQIIYIPIAKKVLAYSSFRDGNGQIVGTSRRFELPVQKGSEVVSTASFVPTPKVKTKRLAEVHFDDASAQITFVGQQKIQEAIEAIKDQKPVEIRVFGFTDTAGDPASNMAISKARADSVAAIIKAAGLDIPLVVEGRGEGAGPYQTPDGVSEPLNRCVGIIAVFHETAQE